MSSAVVNANKNIRKETNKQIKKQDMVNEY